MSTITQPVPLTLPSPGEVYRFTVDQYDRMVRDGTIDEDDPVELLDGIVVRKMPKGPRHDASSAGAGERSSGPSPPAGIFGSRARCESRITTSPNRTSPWSGARATITPITIPARRISPWSSRLRTAACRGTAARSATTMPGLASPSTGSSIWSAASSRSVPTQPEAPPSRHDPRRD